MVKARLSGGASLGAMAECHTSTLAIANSMNSGSYYENWREQQVRFDEHADEVIAIPFCERSFEKREGKLFIEKVSNSTGEKYYAFQDVKINLNVKPGAPANDPSYPNLEYVALTSIRDHLGNFI